MNAQPKPRTRPAPKPTPNGCAIRVPYLQECGPFFGYDGNEDDPDQWDAGRAALPILSFRDDLSHNGERYRQWRNSKPPLVPTLRRATAR